jgi:hypothetical protein
MFNTVFTETYTPTKVGMGLFAYGFKEILNYRFI